MPEQPTVYIVGASDSQVAEVRTVAEKCGLKVQTSPPVLDDPVTRLNTFTVYEGIVIDELSKASAESPVSLALIHLDQFGDLNRTNGHMCGDLLLLELADLLKGVLPDGASAARFSGGQLAVVCPGTGKGQFLDWAESLVCDVRKQSFRAVAVGEKVTVTIGLVTFPSADVSTADQLLEVLTARTLSGGEAGGDRIVD